MPIAKPAIRRVAKPAPTARPAARVAPIVATPQQPSRLRRLARPLPSVRVKPLDEELVETTLQALAEIAQEEVSLKNRKEGLMNTLQRAFAAQEIGKTYISADAMLQARLEETKSKTANTIDPEQFHKQLRANRIPDKEFYECVSVGVTKAKSILTERELLSVTHSVPGKVTGSAVAVSAVKLKK